MKTIAIIWPPANKFFKDIISDISKSSKILDAIKIDLNKDINNFVSSIYPYKDEDLWKLEYKKKILSTDIQNPICILFLEIQDSELKFCDRKQRMIYENVENLKNEIRQKYKGKIDFYSYDNLFHMTDDSKEYEITLLIIKKFLLSRITKHGILDLSKLLMESKDFLPHNEENGKRNKFWIANNTFMFKQSKIDTYEMYSELFADELAHLIGLKVASYFPAKYETNGLLTLNFLENNETLISGNQIIHWFLLEYSKNNSIITIEEICRHNNLAELPIILQLYCMKNRLNFSYDLVTNLKKTFVFDSILLQTDRTPNNWGIIVDNISKNVRFAPLYDNSSIFGMSKKLNGVALVELYDMPTMLRIDENTDFFENKLEFISRLDDEEVEHFLEKYLLIFENLDLCKLFKNIELKHNIIIPEDFKERILKLWRENLEKFRTKIKSKQMSKKFY